MVRTHIFLKERQVKAIKKLAKADEASLAEIIRKAIDEYIEKREGK